MIKIIKQEIKISHELKSKVEWACRLNNTKPIFINGSLLKLEPTNIGYLEPHRAIINNKTYLLFNGHELVPDFKIASAIIHYDETSPHLHIVGVSIKYKSKNGINKQVGKGDAFTRDSLRTIQDKMRVLCIASFNKKYGLNNILKKKEKGRNKDINVKDMTNYQAMKEELNKNKETLEIASKKSNELDKTTSDIKDTINNLKKAPIVKNTYTISESDRNKIIEYVDKVDDTNKDFKKTEMLSVTLNNVDTELQ